MGADTRPPSVLPRAQSWPARAAASALPGSQPRAPPSPHVTSRAAHVAAPTPVHRSRSSDYIGSAKSARRDDSPERSPTGDSARHRKRRRVGTEPQQGGSNSSGSEAALGFGRRMALLLDATSRIASDASETVSVDAWMRGCVTVCLCVCVDTWVCGCGCTGPPCTAAGASSRSSRARRAGPLLHGT